jgi:HAD superfamily hydrolase (TIGR01509 family)
VIRALVFDFDGLILDTETLVFEAWRREYAHHGETLEIGLWREHIGTDGSAFDPLAQLRARVGVFDEAALHARRRSYREARLRELRPLPGVESALDDARAAGIPVALASSSPADWVLGNLERVGLLDAFDGIATGDEVQAAKPAPDVYLLATARLGVRPEESLALEDSPNGVRAAKAAGLRCLAVPGPMTRTLAFHEADAVADSLAERPLREWLRLLGQRASRIGSTSAVGSAYGRTSTT